MADLKSIVGGVGKVAGDGPGESSTSGSTNGSNGSEVVGLALAEDEGGWGLVLGGVGDGVGLASLDTA